MKNGKFITFEGLDGSGKSTQAKHLAQWLRDQHAINVVETREPGGTALGEKLREIVLGGDNYDPLTETLLMLTARREHICKVIKPALLKGEWVVCDRFTDSTIAYQGGGRGVSIETIKELSRLVLDGLTPNLTFYINRPNSDHACVPLLPSLADEKTFETAPADFYQRTANAYKTIIKTEKRVVDIAAISGKRRLTEEEVAKHIQEKIKKLL